MPCLLVRFFFANLNVRRETGREKESTSPLLQSDLVTILAKEKIQTRMQIFFDQSMQFALAGQHVDVAPFVQNALNLRHSDGKSSELRIDFEHGQRLKFGRRLAKRGEKRRWKNAKSFRFTSPSVEK